MSDYLGALLRSSGLALDRSPGAPGAGKRRGEAGGAHAGADAQSDEFAADGAPTHGLALDLEWEGTVLREESPRRPGHMRDERRAGPIAPASALAPPHPALSERAVRVGGRDRAAADVPAASLSESKSARADMPTTPPASASELATLRAATMATAALRWVASEPASWPASDPAADTAQAAPSAPRPFMPPGTPRDASLLRARPALPMAAAPAMPDQNARQAARPGMTAASGGSQAGDAALEVTIGSIQLRVDPPAIRTAGQAEPGAALPSSAGGAGATSGFTGSSMRGAAAGSGLARRSLRRI